MTTANSQMIDTQISARGVSNARVLEAMRQTDRAVFVPPDQQEFAYEDRPIPLMPGATVSQPFIVALMTEMLNVDPSHKVLEVGTGSGYQAAVLARLASEVYGVEVLPELVDYARERFQVLGLTNVRVELRDGWGGLPEEAPYDRIIVTAAPGDIPQALVDQLKPGGRMVIPVGAGRLQELEIVDKTATGQVIRNTHSAVQFVPLVHPE